jgi:hypothetical protein
MRHSYLADLNWRIRGMFIEVVCTLIILVGLLELVYPR